MAFGKQTQQRKDLKAFALKIKTKDLPKPQFQVSERQGQDSKFTPLDPANGGIEDTVTGTLIGVEPKETLWQNKTIKSVNATLTDGDQIYFLTIPYSNLGRGLMNSLLGLTSFNDVQISLYQTKPKTDGGKTYPAVSVRQAGEIVRWKYSNDQLPPPEVITFKGETLRNFEKLELFLAEKLNDLNAVIKKSTPAPSKEVEAAQGAAPAADKDDENIPF